MSRFFTTEANIDGSMIYLKSKEDIHHIAKVLRLGIGDEIDISDSAVWEYKAKIEEITSDFVMGKIVDRQKFAREPELLITLFQGIPKQGKMELIIQKAVELGVNSVVPVFTERTVVTDKGNFFKKLERWQKVSAEAVKQCKRGIIPKICPEIRFKEMINDIVKYDLILFPYENEEELTIKASLRSLVRKPENVAIIIGPEGGFSDLEAEAIKAVGAKCITLGKTILRTETAGMAALAMTMYELEL